MSTREIADVKKTLKGMVTDVSPLNQTPNSYRYALNLLMESREGDYSSLTNEEGTTTCFELSAEESVIGTIPLDNGDVVIFSVEKDLSKSFISILDKDCQLVRWVQSSCLSFSKAHPIHGTWRINGGCDRVIYFTDNHNPVRSINLSNLGSYTDKVGATPQDWIDDANLNDTWNCDFMRHSTALNIPDLTTAVDNIGGGNLEAGAYFFALRYLGEDLSPSNWFYVSHPANISNDSLGGAAISSTYGSGGGPFFTSTKQVQPDGGIVGLPSGLNTSKSVTVDIDNLDTRYKYYQVGVIEFIEGFGTEPTHVYILEEQVISSSTMSFTYTGNNAKTISVLDDLIVPSLVFNRVQSIEQVDNRLVFANGEEDPKNWAVFQRAASAISTTWERYDPQKYRDITPNEDAASIKYSFSTQTFPRDEVISFGVVYVFKDGTESPVFHIPGRPRNRTNTVTGFLDGAALVTAGNANNHIRNQVPALSNWDDMFLTCVADGTLVDPQTEVEEKNVKHIPLFEFVGSPAIRVGEDIERWKVYNTAVGFNFDGLVTDRLVSSGAFAYYEGDETYPDIKDCQGISIWGDDLEGNSLVGEKIRHHRMPDTTLLRLDQNKSRDLNYDPVLYDYETHAIGVIFRGVDTVPVEYASVIQGAYIVQGIKSDENSTVLDTGYVGGTEFFPAGGGPGMGTRPTHASTGTLTEEPPAGTVPPTFVAEEHEAVQFFSPRSQFRKDLKPSGYLKFEEKIYSGLGDYDPDASPSGENYSIHREDRELPDFECTHRSIDAYAYVNRDSIQAAFGGFEQIYNGNRDIDVLFLHLEDAKTQLKDNPANDPRYFYCSVKQWVKPYDNIFNITYQRTQSRVFPTTFFDTNPVMGGEIYQTELTMKSVRGIALVDANNSWIFSNFYCESQVNADLRLSGSEVGENHWRQYGSTSLDFLEQEIDPDPDPGTFDPTPNFFAENKDMTKNNSFNPYYPLNRVYNFCSACEGSFPTRIWYSEKAYQETTSDNYKIFLANNYRDILSETGEITHLFVYKDQLYAQTPTTTWFVATRPQQLQSNEGTIFVGTGDVLSIPPKRIESVDRGYAGNLDKHATTVTEFGVIWPDREAGKVFLFNKQLTEVSANGMRNWFAENLDFVGGVNEQIDGFRIDATSHKSSIGYIATFDPRHNRYILHKKYYKIIDNSFLSSLTVTDDYQALVNPGYNTTTGEFYDYSGGSPVILDIIPDRSIVEDLSWTISYSLPNKAWASYHSYRPNWMWHTRTGLASYRISSSQGWDHGSRNYGTYYNQNHPSVLNFVFNKNPTQTKVFNSLDLITSSHTWIGEDLVEIHDDSFSEAYLYTSTQSSGLLSLIIKNSFDLTDPFLTVNPILDTVPIQNNEGTWNFSEFYDLTTDYTLPIFTTDWSDPVYAALRNYDGFIDFPNSARDSFTKNLFEVSPMRGKWLGVWLWYTNVDLTKFTIDFLGTSENISFK